MAIAERATGTRERLIEAGRELFLQRGYAETGVRAIAERAFCNVSLIKHYFGSKDGLLRAIVVEGITAVGDEVRTILSRDSPPEDRLLGFIDFLVDHVAAHHGLFQIVHREMECMGNVAPEILPRIAALQDLLVGVLTELRDEKGLRDVDPAIAATMLVAMVRFYFMAQPFSTKVLGPPTPELLSSLKRHVATIFLHGILAEERLPGAA